LATLLDGFTVKDLDACIQEQLGDEENLDVIQKEIEAEQKQSKLAKINKNFQLNCLKQRA
jgi:hypothetical protein